MPDVPEVDRGDSFVSDPEPTVDVAPPEPAKEAEPAAAPAEKKGDENLIPRERFNEAVGKERAKREVVEARARELEGQLATQRVSEDVVGAQKQLKDLVKQRNQMLSDGELDKAGEVDGSILALQEAISDRKAESKVSLAKEAAKEEMRYDSIVSKLEMDHAELDPESDDYSQEAVDEIRVLTRGYQVEMGLPPSAALARAAKRVFGEKITPKVDVSAAKEAGLKRKAEATERNIDAAKKQPASTKEIGLDHDKRGGGMDAKTIMSMNYKEFSELSEDVLSRMRGDSL